MNSGWGRDSHLDTPQFRDGDANFRMMLSPFLQLLSDKGAICRCKT